MKRKILLICLSLFLVGKTFSRNTFKDTTNVLNNLETILFHVTFSKLNSEFKNELKFREDLVVGNLSIAELYFSNKKSKYSKISFLFKNDIFIGYTIYFRKTKSLKYYRKIYGPCIEIRKNDNQIIWASSSGKIRAIVSLEKRKELTILFKK